MGPTLFLFALPVAVVSAVRGIWSPCGLSMLSSLTPMTESGRGNRFGITAAWFTAGGVLGGISLGALAAAGAAALDALGLEPSTRLAIGAALALVTAAIDLGLLGVDLPILKRQVNDAWLRRYRSWVYGAGFGCQIGFGVATYIMTAGVLLTIALAVLTASPTQALVIGGVFGAVRGSAVLIGRSATTPAALGRVHQRLDAAAPASRAAAAWVQVLTAAALAGLAWHPVAAIAVVGLALLSTLRSTARLALRP